MSVELRPMRLGEILDRTFQVYRDRFWAFAAVSAIPSLAMLALQLANSYWWHLEKRIEPDSATQRGGYFLGALIWLGFYHVSIIVHSVFTPALLKQCSSSLSNDPLPLRSSFRFAFARWKSFLWIGILILLVILIGTELLTAGVFTGMGYALDAMGLLDGKRDWPFVVLLLIPVAGFVLFMWACGCFGFAACACAFEDIRGVKALRRSWILSRESRWRVAGAWLMVLMVGWFLSSSTALALRWLFFLFSRTWHSHLLMRAYVPGVYADYALLSIALMPLYPIAVTVFYYDQRIRKEGFDIEHMMESAGMTGMMQIPSLTSPMPNSPMPKESGAGEYAPVAMEELDA